MEFNYNEAFVRNIGLVTEEEQERLRSFTIAIPGMGGVGGVHLIALVRQGFEKFKIADIDAYELKNFNRQYGARTDTLGRKKVEVMREEALKINPNCTIEVFDEGISEKNIDTFLKGVDLAVDALDAFSVDVRRLFINAAVAHSIPLITAGPIGFGTAFLVFMPGGKNFDQYFAVSDTMSYWDKLTSFFIGLAPRMLQMPYMHKVSLEDKQGPSSSGSVSLCAGIVAIYALKILLKKGVVRAVPYYHQFDVMRDVYVVKRLWLGNHNPLQKIKRIVAVYMLKRTSTRSGSRS